jgi:hypothetical protein
MKVEGRAFALTKYKIRLKQTLRLINIWLRGSRLYNLILTGLEEHQPSPA